MLKVLILKCHADLTPGWQRSSKREREGGFHNLPCEGSPRVVHVLFPVSTPVSPSVLAFKKIHNVSEICWNMYFTQACLFSLKFQVPYWHRQTAKNHRTLSDPPLNILLLFSLLGNHHTDVRKKRKDQVWKLISVMFEVPLLVLNVSSYFHPFIRPI